MEQTTDTENSDRRFLISIACPPPDPTYPKIDMKVWRNVLCLKFHDISYATSRGEHPLVLFSDDQAYDILQFLKFNEHRDYAIVHCDAGISRSAGVAKFIAGIYGLKFPEHYTNHNSHVFSTLLKVYGVCSFGEGRIKPEDLPGLAMEK